ncbi:hypothetical protein QQ045_015359 [Rhodiola kirilowii]
MPSNVEHLSNICRNVLDPNSIRFDILARFKTLNRRPSPSTPFYWLGYSDRRLDLGVALMDRLRSHRRLQVNVPSDAPIFDDEGSEDLRDDVDEGSLNDGSGDQAESFMGGKTRRRASLHRDYQGDYLDVPSNPRLINILKKQGDGKLLFADKVVKFTGTGKMKKRILLITSSAIYMVDPDTTSLKRRVILKNIDKISLSEMSDNFFAITIRTEYDLLIASTRKTEIVTILVDAVKSASDHELEVEIANSFSYSPAADSKKEVRFEEVEGGVRTRIIKKSVSSELSDS